MEVGERAAGACHDPSSPLRPTSAQLSLESTTGAYDDGPLLSAAEGRASRPSSAHSVRSKAESSVASGDESDEEERIAAQEQMHAMLELSQNARSFHAAEEDASSAASARSRMLSPVASGDDSDGSDEEERVAAQQQMHAILELSQSADAFHAAEEERECGGRGSEQMHAMLEVVEEEDAKRLRVISQPRLNHIHHPGVDLRANLKSISLRCHLFEVSFVWELTKETMYLPLGCLQSGA